MKRGLLAGGILLGCLLLVGGIAAADISTSGSVTFQINGNPAGLFSGSVSGKLSTSFSAAADSWSGGLSASIAGEGGTLSLRGAYIQYTAEMGSLKMQPLGVSYAIYDLGANIASNPGVTLTATLEPLTLTTVINNADNGAGGVDWNYGIGGEYKTDLVTVGAKYNSNPAYGVQIVGAMDPITLTGEYAGYQGGTAYLVKAVYALSRGKVTAKYTVKDAAYTGGTATTEIYGELAGFPITDTTTLKLTAKSTDGSTTFTGETATTLAENVTLTLHLESAAGTLTYYGKVRISF